MGMNLKKIISHVKKYMRGRMCDEQDNIYQMAEAALIHGNHLEIGTLHGGSAIVVAMAKREYGLSGRVVCVDPLNGYYAGTKYYRETDPISGVPINADVVLENAARFGVELEVLQMSSEHAFSVLKVPRFASTYIDGNHWGNAPLFDFVEASKITDEVIIFDNYEKKHPDVVSACHAAAREWIKQEPQKGITFIVRKP